MRRTLEVILGIVVIFGLIAYAIFLIMPEIITPMLELKWWQTGDNIVILRNLGLIVLGAIGLPLAIWRSWIAERGVRLAAAGQNLDRYQKGAAALSDDLLSVRQAGIFGLEELAKSDFKNHYEMVQKTLCAFVRERSEVQRRQAEDETEAWQVMSNPKLPPIESDMQAAITAISSLRELESKHMWDTSWRRLYYLITKTPPQLRKSFKEKIEFDLSNANLTKVNLVGGNLTKVSFINACFDSGKLTGTNFSDCIFDKCNFDNARMHRANLTGTTIFNSSLKKTNLASGNLRGAKVMFSDFAGSVLHKTQFGEIETKPGHDFNVTRFSNDFTILFKVKNLTAIQFSQIASPDQSFLGSLQQQEETIADVAD